MPSLAETIKRSSAMPSQVDTSNGSSAMSSLVKTTKGSSAMPSPVETTMGPLATYLICCLQNKSMSVSGRVLKNIRTVGIERVTS
ncbi:hypothetical protein DPMN_152120 [Dreissena polymorpha]|uniref:Uncharacterized protein n=1 Tax=Dreissena polymorpha TaxID=45954 RepID=A0A9D4FGW7_DREPO|nr:hypothetical protein DPMN_152120 [Dreissena polymorpha]